MKGAHRSTVSVLHHGPVERKRASKCADLEHSFTELRSAIVYATPVGKVTSPRSMLPEP
jgi:hypothetical protein